MVLEKKIDVFTHSIKDYNEDIYGITEDAFWVLDGASALNKSQLTDHENDVYWIVNWWNSYLHSAIKRYDQSLAEILRQGITKLNCEFTRFAEVHTLSKLDRVSAAIAIARINGERLECFVLGDVEINIQTRTNKLIRLTCEEICALDHQVMALMAADEKREEKIVFKGFTQKELDLLRLNRSKMNTAEGYYILEHDETAIEHGLYEEFALEDVKSLLLMTDGYAQLYQTYDLAEVFRLTQEQGIEQVVSELRIRETQDSAKKAFQRLKTHDDVTAISVIF